MTENFFQKGFSEVLLRRDSETEKASREVLENNAVTVNNLYYSVRWYFENKELFLSEEAFQSLKKVPLLLEQINQVLEMILNDFKKLDSGKIVSKIELKKISSKIKEVEKGLKGISFALDSFYKKSSEREKDLDLMYGQINRTNERQVACYADILLLLEPER